MFSCITCNPAAKEKDEENEHRESRNPRPKEPTKSITKQLKGLALKVTGSHHRQSKRGKESTRYQRRLPESDSESEHIPSYVGGGSRGSTPGWDMTACEHDPAGESSTFVAVPTPPRAASANDVWGEEEEEEEYESHEWLAHVEEGINITFASLPTGGNDLRKIRFSREMFDRDLAQRWWIENYDRLRELYNVQSFNRQAVIPPAAGSDDEQEEESSRLSRLMFEQEGSGSLVNQAASEALDQAAMMGQHAQQFNEGSSSSTAVEAAAADAPATLTPANSFRIDPNASREVEWVEQDEPGVFITIKKSADGTRQIRRLRFSRKRFETEDAKNWWLENKARVEAQYL